MCRLLGYVGPERDLESLLVTPERSLYHQAYDPQYQTSGTVNADGFGVGWYKPEARREPAIYRSVKPIWSDRSFLSFSALVTAPLVIAAVRGATPPIVTEESNVPPFEAGPYLFAHNGSVEGFRERAASRLRRSLSEERDAAILGTTDSEVLFALVLDRLDRGASPVDALAETVTAVLDVAPARLNMMLSDGDAIYATVVGDSLFTREGTGTLVTSEPLDDSDEWARIPDGSVVTAIADGYSSERLPGVASGVVS